MKKFHLIIPISCIIFFSGLQLISDPIRSDPILSIETKTLHKGRNKGEGERWFLPRFSVQPNDTIFMTIQNIYKADYYGAVRFTESKDNGITWSEPINVPSFGRRHEIPLKASIKSAVSDVASVYHAKTNTNILIGEVIYYDAGKKANPMPPRYPVYTVRDKHGKWHGKKRLVWKDSRGSSVYSAGSAQIDVQPNGDLLIPISFRPLGNLAFSVATLLCSFDGKTIRVKKVSNELSYNVDRGFLEPQIVKHGDMYYMTIRAEDGRGYVSSA